jgi:hypothetical protein
VLVPRATPSHRRVRRLHGAPPSLASGDVVRGCALRGPGGALRGRAAEPRPRPSPGGTARLSARSARVAARGGCAGGAAVGGRGASAGGLACSVRGVARLGGGGGGVDARRAAAATRALGSGDARDGSASYDDKLAAARAARAMKPTQGGGGGRAAAVALDRLITQDEIPEGLLCLVAEELGSLNDVNVATAFSKLGKLCSFRSFPRNVAADDRFRGLTVLARDMCADGRLQAQAVANITHALGKMSAAGKLAADDADVQDTLAALEGQVVRVGPDMKPQEVANAIWAFATLLWEPGAETWAALETAVERVAPDMKPQEVANAAWGFATLGLMPGAEARAALETAVVRVGPNMDPQAASNVAWGFATLGLMPGAEARAALEAAVVCVGPDMKPQAVSNVTWGFATLGLMPGADARAALEAAVVRVGPDMKPQETANAAWGFATLGWEPRADARAALEAAVERVGPDMNPQAVSTTLWSVLSLAATRAVPLPAYYPSLWQAACGFEERSFNRVDISMLFHAHLIHTELVGGVARGEVTFPPWIMHQAREAWMYSARDDVTVSRSVKEIASILGDLGIRNEVERLTDDGYLSVDVYLPDDDVALEFDGPSHFIKICDGDEGAAPGGVGDASRASTRNTMSTELRDMFLARRHRVVLPVPYFEFAKLKGRTMKTEYVAEKLRAAGVAMQAVNRDGEEEN